MTICDLLLDQDHHKVLLVSLFIWSLENLSKNNQGLWHRCILLIIAFVLSKKHIANINHSSWLWLTSQINQLKICFFFSCIIWTPLTYARLFFLTTILLVKLKPVAVSFIELEQNVVHLLGGQTACAWESAHIYNLNVPKPTSTKAVCSALFTIKYRMFS